MLLKDKVVIVTGGSRGIGRGIAVECARHGADVVINYARDAAGTRAPTAAQEVVAEIEALGRRAVAIKGDIAQPETAQALVDAAVANFGGVDVAVANAGVCQFHDFLGMPARDHRHQPGGHVFPGPGGGQAHEGAGPGWRHHRH